MAKKKIEGPKPVVHKVEMIADALLFDHPNNTNKQSKHVQQELVESIQKHGFDENLIVVPRNDGTPGYFIVSGNHRRRAGRSAGMDEFPCVVRKDWDEIESRIQLARRNLVRGDIDRVLFTEEVNKLSSQYNLALDVIMGQMGFEDSEAFAEFYKAEKAKEQRALGQAVAASQTNVGQIKMLDDIGIIVSTLTEKYGKSIPQSFMIFPLGGRNHIYVAVTPALKKSIDAIATKCIAEGLDFNTVCGGLLQIAIHSTKLFEQHRVPNQVIETGSGGGEDNLELLKEDD